MGKKQASKAALSRQVVYFPDDDTCYLHSDAVVGVGNYYIPVVGVNGPQMPGTCENDPVRTGSLEDGQQKIDAEITGVDFQFLGIPSSSQDCGKVFL